MNDLFAVGRYVDELLRPRDGVPGITGLHRGRRELLNYSSVAIPPRSLLDGQPLLELGRVLQDESARDVAAVECYCLLEPAGARQRRIIETVRGDAVTIDDQLFLAVRNDDVAKDALQLGQPLAERGAGFLLLRIGPQDTDHGVAPNRAFGSLDNQVDEQSQILRTADVAVERTAVCVLHIHSAEEAKSNHGNSLKGFENMLRML